MELDLGIHRNVARGGLLMYLFRLYMQKYLELKFLIGWKVGFSEGTIKAKDRGGFQRKQG